MPSLTLSFLLCIFNGMYSKEVTHVPGLKEQLNFKHYSGYLAVTHNHMLHYWFVESQNNPATAPMLLWLNGGPGCSSLVGFLTEIGPFLVNDDGKTVKLNPYSWNQHMNIIFLESPAGTGYSYATDGNITTDDDQVARENYKALKMFFTKFPQFKNNGFYMAGQSYGGVYVPTLSKLIIDGKQEFELNLKGILIANGYVDASININTGISFMYWHGLLNESEYTTLKAECCNNKCLEECKYVRHLQHDRCYNKSIDILFNEKGHTELVNLYDIYANCTVNWEPDSMHFGMFVNHDGQSSQSLLQKQPKGVYSCVDTSALESYVRQQELREALFIPPEALIWDTCGNYGDKITWLYENEGMSNHVKHALTAGVKVLMYYGDTDAMCNYGLAEAFAEQLNINVRNDTANECKQDVQLLQSRRPWYYGDQNAGYVTKYEGLEVYTVKGAGHMAAQSKRPEVLQLVSQFILGK